jgi:hypothetical protein
MNNIRFAQVFLRIDLPSFSALSRRAAVSLGGWACQCAVPTQVSMCG